MIQTSDCFAMHTPGKQTTNSVYIYIYITSFTIFLGCYNILTVLRELVHEAFILLDFYTNFNLEELKPFLLMNL